MRVPKQVLARLFWPVFAGAVCMFATLSAMTAVAEWRDPTPRIGDVMTIHTVPSKQQHIGQKLFVLTTDKLRCTLDIDILLRSGGSFILEQAAGADGQYQLHWAGGPTARDATNCGDSADIIVDGEQLHTLQAAAARSAQGEMRIRVFSPFEAT